MSTLAEFYDQNTSRLLARVNAGAVPKEGELIVIKKITYEVRRRTWAVDQSGTGFDRRLRANLDLRKLED